jgi:hypothetical protein
MMAPLGPEHPLRRLFAGSVQHALYAKVGMCDPQIAEYLTDMLCGLLRMDDLFPFHDAAGKRIEDLAEWLTAVEFEGDSAVEPPHPLPEYDRQRIVHRHIGDFSLFWTGVYPEGVGRLKTRGVGDRLNDLARQGKRSYAIASELTAPEDQPPPGVLKRLSEQFEFCAYGLNLCRQEWDALRRQREQP